MNIGFNRGVAWSHTVSTARRFTPYELELRRRAPRPTTGVDGRPVAMRKRTVRVRVRGGGFRRHTFYSTRWGPVFSFSPGGPDVDGRARVRARRRQRRQLPAPQPVGRIRQGAVGPRPASARTARCRATRGSTRSRPTRAGAPTTPTSRWCRTSTPRCSAAARPTTRSRGLLVTQGVMLLDGTRAACRWKRDRDALAPGIIGPKALPRVVRRDYVENSNDSYWLPSARFRLPGFARIIGGEETQRALRTRLGLMQAEQRLAGTDGLGPAGFTLPHAPAGRVRQPQPQRRAGARDATVVGVPASGRADLARGVRGARRLGRPRRHRLARRGAVARVLVGRSSAACRGRFRSTRTIRSDAARLRRRRGDRARAR